METIKDTHTCDECGQVLDGHNSRFDPEYGGTCDNCIEMKIEGEYEDLIYDERGDDEEDGFYCEPDCKHCEAEQVIENEILEDIDEAFFYSCECGYEGEDSEYVNGYCPSCDKPVEVNLKPDLITTSSGKSAVGKNKNGQ